MRIKKYDRPFNKVLIRLRVDYKMDGNLWGVQFAPKVLSERDCGMFLAQKPSWNYRHYGTSEVTMYGSQIFRRGAIGDRESHESALWRTEPVDLASLGDADTYSAVMDGIKSTLYRAVSRITSGIMGNRDVRDLGARLGVGELVRQRARFALAKLLLDLEYKHILSPANIKRGKGTRLSRLVNIDDLGGNDQVEFTVEVLPHYDNDYIKSFSCRFRRKHEKAQYKRLAKRYRELKAKYDVMEAKLMYSKAQYESAMSRFRECQRELIKQHIEEGDKDSQ